VGFFEFHASFSEIIPILRRIADALDRLAPPVGNPQQPYTGPKIGVESISRPSDLDRRERERDKIGIDHNVWRRYGYGSGHEGSTIGRETTTAAPVMGERQADAQESGKLEDRSQITRTGVYDRDDPLDVPAWLDEDGTGDPGNYVGS